MDKKYIGYFPICSGAGLAILDIDDAGDTARAAWILDGVHHAERRHKIYYTWTGRAYIVKRQQRYYFDQITRTGAGA